MYDLNTLEIKTDKTSRIGVNQKARHLTFQ